MPTNLAIDDSFLEKARRIGKLRTKKETVTVALEEFIQRRRQRQLLKSLGTVDYIPHPGPSPSTAFTDFPLAVAQALERSSQQSGDNPLLSDECRRAD